MSSRIRGRARGSAAPSSFTAEPAQDPGLDAGFRAGLCSVYGEEGTSDPSEHHTANGEYGDVPVESLADLGFARSLVETLALQPGNTAEIGISFTSEFKLGLQLGGSVSARLSLGVSNSGSIKVSVKVDGSALAGVVSSSGNLSGGVTAGLDLKSEWYCKGNYDAAAELIAGTAYSQIREYLSPVGIELPASTVTTQQVVTKYVHIETLSGGAYGEVGNVHSTGARVEAEYAQFSGVRVSEDEARQQTVSTNFGGHNVNLKLKGAVALNNVAALKISGEASHTTITSEGDRHYDAETKQLWTWNASFTLELKTGGVWNGLIDNIEDTVAKILVELAACGVPAPIGTFLAHGDGLSDALRRLGADATVALGIGISGRAVQEKLGDEKKYALHFNRLRLITRAKHTRKHKIPFTTSKLEADATTSIALTDWLGTDTISYLLSLYKNSDSSCGQAQGVWLHYRDRPEVFEAVFNTIWRDGMGPQDRYFAPLFAAMQSVVVNKRQGASDKDALNREWATYLLPEFEYHLDHLDDPEGIEALDSDHKGIGE